MLMCRPEEKLSPTVWREPGAPHFSVQYHHLHRVVAGFPSSLFPSLSSSLKWGFLMALVSEAESLTHQGLNL